MKLSQTLCLILFLAPQVRAQQAVPQPSLPPLPPGPLIQKRAPDFASWIIRPPSMAVPGSSSSGTSRTQSQKAQEHKESPAAFIKTGQIIPRQTADDTGRVWNTWCVEGLQITVWPGGQNWIIQSRGSDPTVPTANYVDYSNTDFPGFDWISQRNYAGIKNVLGRPCIVFADKIIANGALELTDAVAYVDLATRYPIALKVGGEVTQYEFQTPPRAPLVLPPAICRW
jgi:hypothetical protein